MDMKTSSRNLGIDLVRVTELAALAAGRWVGLGVREEADFAANKAMLYALNMLEVDGQIVIGEEGKLSDETILTSGQKVGTGQGQAMDVVVDAIDGAKLLITGRSGAMSVIAVAPANTMWSPKPAVYMEKIIVDREVAQGLVRECLNAPPAWTLALIARLKKKPIRDLNVFVLARTRHEELIEEIRSAGARVHLRADGDIAGAILAATPGSNVDALMGIGGVLEGLITACAVKALNGGMLGRLAPQSQAEWQAVEEANLDIHRILSGNELVQSDNIFFVATGITDGGLLQGVRYDNLYARTESILMRVETGTRRTIITEHLLEKLDFDVNITVDRQ